MEELEAIYICQLALCPWGTGAFSHTVVVNLGVCQAVPDERLSVNNEELTSSKLSNNVECIRSQISVPVQKLLALLGV
jgi:hypothetical protein